MDISTTKLPFIIDVEASGFGPESYPIEIGVALGSGQRYCSLIKPAPHWTHWDKEAERVHHIERDVLNVYGKPVTEVAESLNTMFEEQTLYSDGWVVDLPWLIKLFHEANVSMKFHVSPIEMILSEDQMSIWHDTRDMVEAGSESYRHRASHDAWMIQQTYSISLMQSQRTIAVG